MAATKKENLKREALEVEVIIPEDVLEKESHFKKTYIDGKLTYNLGDEIPKNVQDTISNILKTSKVEELVKFNPLIVALEELQSFKNLKYDKEKKNEKEYTESNKKIGSFNSATKATTDFMKKDAQDYIKSINSLKELLETESKATREILQQNFKEYLDEKSAIAKAKEDKKNKEILEANQRLTKENEEQALKLKNQRKESKILTIQGEIGKISFSATSGVSVLNLDGLQRVKKELEQKKFEDYLSVADITEYAFTDDEKFELENNFNNAVSTSLNAINVAIEKITIAAQNTALKSENEVMKAQQPSSILSTENDLPFTQASPSITEERPNNQEFITDSERVENMCFILNQFKDHINVVCEQISEIKFEDPGLEKVQEKITGASFDQLKDWGAKLSAWAEQKKNLYNDYLTKQNQ